MLGYPQREDKPVDSVNRYNNGKPKRPDDSKEFCEVEGIEDPRYGAKEILELRIRLKMTKKAFAQMLGITPKTVERWEDGNRRPSRLALRLLYLIDLDVALVNNLLKGDNC